MTNEQLDQAFEATVKQWEQANHALFGTDLRIARFMFFAGSEFGCNAAAEIYSGAFGKPSEEVEGHPV